ncbi:hypothetical protein SAMN05519104_4001 [Rhizobiales bacterium GAS188]|nr:hypothetical protein SAMN05519104_4001 [Rhizobiales bacterium GAS188]
MVDTPAPYIPHSAGDLITAEDWNAMQVDVRQDIATQIATSIANVKDVAHATNADTLDGKNLADLTQAILDQVFAQLPKRTGYMRVFCNLRLHADKIIPHNLKAYPVTDLYQLDYFEVVCAKGEKPEDAVAEWVLFYLYHADERRLRIPPHTDAIDIETDPKFRILWKTLIDYFKEQKLLDYDDNTTLDDLEVDFWRAMFKSPNDEFDPDSYCHSPWFEKCCGEKRTVGELTKHGDFDDIYLKIKPQKTINFPLGTTSPAPDPDAGATAEPTNVRVSQLDLDTVALRLLEPPIYPASLGPAPTEKTPIVPLPEGYKDRLPVMLLLKV